MCGSCPFLDYYHAIMLSCFSIVIYLTKSLFICHRVVYMRPRGVVPVKETVGVLWGVFWSLYEVREPVDKHGYFILVRSTIETSPLWYCPRIFCKARKTFNLAFN